MSKAKRADVIYSESVFMDSGAFSLYGLHVGGGKEKIGKTGRVLERVKGRRWGAGDYSYFNLQKGSDFRAYCDYYASFMKKMAGTDVLFTTVDAIMNPEISWDVQQYFEQEHGLKPIPVIHGGTPLRYLYRYLETGRYDMLGFGGLGHLMRVGSYTPWADSAFAAVCPKSNNYLPIARIHGFAMTSWTLMSRWPWWSVDSATWIKLAAYGWIIVPRWSAKEQRFVHDKPPYQLNMSRKPTERKTRFAWREGVKSPRQTKDRHYDNTSPAVRESADRWLAHLKVPMGSFDGDEIKVAGATSCFRVRARVNLHYFKDFEESRPEWPHPLDNKIVEAQAVKYRKGFGL